MAGERSDLGKIFITDGGIYDANTTYEKLTMVSYNNSTYITLRTVTGVTPSNDRINYGLMAQGFTATYLSSVTAEDVQGLVVEAGSETPAQSLINAIADRVANQLVSNSDLQDILGDYILKSAIANNLSITEEGKVLDARQGKTLNDALTSTNSTLSAVNSRRIHHRNINVTTNAQGNASITSAVPEGSVISVVPMRTDTPILTSVSYIANLTTNPWWVHLSNVDGTSLANTTLMLVVHYANVPVES